MGEFIATLATKFATALFGKAAAGTWYFKAAVWAATAVIYGVPLIMAGKALLPKMDLKGMGGRSQMVRSPIQSRKIVYGEARVGGTILYMAEGDSGVASKREHLYLVLALAYKECDSIQAVYANDDELTINVSGHVTSPTRYYPNSNPRFSFYGLNDMLGTTSQTLNSTTTTYTDLTSSDQFKDIVCLQTAMAYDPEVFTSGVPNISAKIRGRKILDYRTSTTAWSDNPALCIYDYLTNSDYGLGVAANRIDTSTFTQAANDCDDTITLTSGTQKRYTCNGVIDTASSLKSNLETLLSACAGNLTYSNGKFKLVVGKWRSSTTTINEVDLRGDIQLVTKPSRRETFNTVRGTFIGEESSWVVADYPEIKDSAAITADGETLVSDLALPMTNTAVMCERIAKIYLKKSRMSYTMTLPLKLTKFAIEPMDIVTVNLPTIGIQNKTFEVVDWKFGTNAGDKGDITIGCDVVLREIESSVFDWSNSEEIGYTETAAPTVTKINDVAVPTFSLTALETTATDGTVVSNIEVNISDSTDDRHIYEYDIYYKKTSDTNFETISTLRDSD